MASNISLLNTAQKLKSKTRIFTLIFGTHNHIASNTTWGSLDEGHSYHLGEKCYPGDLYYPLGLTQEGYKSCLGNIFHPGDSYDH